MSLTKVFKSSQPSCPRGTIPTPRMPQAARTSPRRARRKRKDKSADPQTLAARAPKVKAPKPPPPKAVVSLCDDLCQASRFL